MDLNKRRLDDDFREEDQRSKRMRTDNAGLDVGLLFMNKDVGQIIGKGGETIKSIRIESGARVNIQSLVPNSHERIGDVKGDFEQVSKAVQMIATSICEDRPTITLLAEARNLGPLIGKGGATINKIRTETRANVDIGRECLGDSTQKEIRIEGDPQAVSQAIASIVEYLAEGKSHVRVPYEPYGGGAFNRPRMGRGGGRGRGDRPQFTRQRSDRGGGFNIPPVFREKGGQWPDFRDSNSMFRGRSMPFQEGRDSNLGRGRGRGRGSRSALRIETNVYVPRDMIGKIIGRGGSNINTIRRQSGATIVIDSSEENKPERKITITGEKQAMDLACSMLGELADSF